MRIQYPKHGEKIQKVGDEWVIPDQVQIPYIVGDGVGADINPVMRHVIDTTVAKAYGGKRAIHWFEIYAGQKAMELTCGKNALPQETLDAICKYHVAIKGPLETPVGGGLRSLNVALRQQLDLYLCMRPVKYYPGVPSPVKQPEKVDMTVFRENSEDIYTGIEFTAGSREAEALIMRLKKRFVNANLRFPKSSGVGLKIISEEASKRLVRSALRYALDTPGVGTVTLVHKGNIMKYTEGSFCKWGYEIARSEFAAKPTGIANEHKVLAPDGREVIVNDVIADAFFQAILLTPEKFQVIATMNLNGDYISDALAAQVGGIGIAPGANFGDRCALFEATHGTAPGLEGMNKVNPLSLILSANIMLNFFHWHEASELLEAALVETIKQKKVTFDFAMQMEGVVPLSTSDFQDALVSNIHAVTL